MKSKLQRLRQGEALSSREALDCPPPWNIQQDEDAGEWVIYDLHHKVVGRVPDLKVAEYIRDCCNALAVFNHEELNRRGLTNPTSIVTEFTNALSIVDDLLQGEERGERTLREDIEYIYDLARDGNI